MDYKYKASWQLRAFTAFFAMLSIPLTYWGFNSAFNEGLDAIGVTFLVAFSFSSLLCLVSLFSSFYYPILEFSDTQIQLPNMLFKKGGRIDIKKISELKIKKGIFPRIEISIKSLNFRSNFSINNTEVDEVYSKLKKLSGLSS